MRTGQKRKRPTANDITSSTNNNNSNNTSLTNNTNRGRQRLQRASKDKVYAERLAASSNDNDFNGSNNNNGSGIDDNINTQEVGACAISQQSNTNGSKRSTRSSKSASKSSNTSTSNTTTTRSKRSKSTRRNTEKVLSPPPPNWPFTSNSSSSTTSKGGSKAAKGGKKKSTRDGNGKSGGDKLSLPPNWPFTEPTTSKGSKSSAKGDAGKKKSSSSRGTSSRKSKDSTSCESSISTGVSTNVVDDDKKKKGQKYKQQPVAPRKQSLQQLRQEEEDKGDDDVGKEEIMSATRSTRSGMVREMKSTAVSKSKQKECANDSELVDSDEDNDEVEKKKLPVSMKQPTIDKLSPPTSISTKSSSAISKATAAASKKTTKPTSIDKLSPPTLHNHTEPIPKAKATPKTTKSSVSIDKLSPPTLQSNTKPVAQSSKPTAPKAKAAESKTTTDWSCNRCTLLNNNRKKKCTACGTPRYLTVGLDGTFALDESRGSSGSAAAVREETKSCKSSSACAAAAKADEVEEGDQSEESQQSQLSAMIDAPVFTRSRRKEHLSLTQSSSPKPATAKEDKVDAQAKEGDDTRDNEGDDQPEENDGSQAASNHIPLQLEQQQEEHQNKESEQQPSEFKQWIQKRHEKKREKKAKKRQRRKSLVPVKVITVRPFVNGEHILLDSNDASMNVDEEQSESSQQQQQILEAVVEISVLCRIEERSNEQLPDGAAASEDKVRGEQSTPQESDSSEMPLKEEEKSVCQENRMEDEGSMEQKLPQGSASEEVPPKREEESSTTETTRHTGDDLIAKLAASTLLNMQGVSAEVPSSDQQGPAQQDQASAMSQCPKESVDDSTTLAAKPEADKPSSEEISEKVIQQQPEEVTDHHNTVNKQMDKDDCAKQVTDACHDDTAKLPADTLNGGNNNNFNDDETSQVPNHDECNNKLNEQECSTSSVSDGRQKEETLPPNEASHKKDEDKSQQNQGQVAYHEEAKRDLAISTTYPSNSQGVASIHSPFIQMTQQLPDFDYMSQVCYSVLLFITQITLNLFHDRLNLTIFSVSGFIWYPNELYGQDSPASGRKKIYGGGCASKFKCQDLIIRSSQLYQRKTTKSKKRATSRDKGCPS